MAKKIVIYKTKKDLNLDLDLPPPIILKTEPIPSQEEPEEIQEEIQEEVDVVIPTWIYVFANYWILFMLLPLLVLGPIIFVLFYLKLEFWMGASFLLWLGLEILFACISGSAIKEWNEFMS